MTETLTLEDVVWTTIGNVTLCELGRPKFPDTEAKAGLLKLVFPNSLDFIGHSKDIWRRLDDFRNPKAGVSTDHRVHDLIVAARGAVLQVFVHPSLSDSATRTRLRVVAAALGSAISDRPAPSGQAVRPVPHPVEMVAAPSRSPSKQSCTSAHVAQPNSANEVSTPSRLPWQPAGDVTICDKGRPAFQGIPTTAGVYRLDIGDHSYIGQGGNLRQRLHEYRNPTDNFDEHYRRHRIVQAGGAKLFLITNQEMEDRTTRLGMERAAIAEATSDGMSLLNRGKKAKNYFRLKAEFLEEQIALTRKAHDAAD